MKTANCELKLAIVKKEIDFEVSRIFEISTTENRQPMKTPRVMNNRASTRAVEGAKLVPLLQSAAAYTSVEANRQIEFHAPKKARAKSGIIE